ncbi:MAG: sulfatase-like hydrolase/transferase, partial [Proteobacteria bacterium]|nr:sulfatase-like hydrolase/transferase [Pseudomonadota bacterium]
MVGGPRRIGRRAVALAALVWLYLLLAVRYDVYRQAAFLHPGLPAELVGFVALALGAGRIGPRAGRALGATLVGALTLLVLVRLGDVAAAGIFGRRLDLVWDARHVPVLIEMAGEAGLPASAVGLALLVALAGLVGSIAWAGRRLMRALGEGRPRRLALAALAVAAVLLAAEPAVPLLARTELVSHEASAALLRQAAEAKRWLFDREEALRAFAAAGAGIAEGRTALPGLGARDVYLVVVESYGAALVEDPEFRPGMAAFYRSAEERLAGGGVSAASGRLRSPTVGGMSWLAHSTLAGGVEISDQFHYELFERSGHQTLVHLFKRSGYRTVLFMPGMRGVWPEGRRKGFDKMYLAADLAYPGPAFGFFGIPDQFTLARIRDWEIAAADRPLFVQAVLISSHFPFQPVPPSLPEGARLDDPRAWRAAGGSARAEPDWRDLRGRYLRAVGYSLEQVFAFVRSSVAGDALVIVVGDHQPAAFIGRGHGGADVPVHALSRDRALLEAFVALGYRPGLAPPAGEAGE